MNHRLAPTPFADINSVLGDFRSALQGLLAEELVGIYLVGSLALGDFDPRRSDIDLVVVTSTEIGPDRFTALQHAHTQLAASNSPWAQKIEAIYVHPDYACQGIGSFMLSHAIGRARHGYTGPIRVVATLNAESFYAKHSDSGTLLTELNNYLSQLSQQRSHQHRR